MRKDIRHVTILLLACAALAFAGAAAQEEDAEGCKDHPMLSRLKGFYISSCESNFDAADFYTAEGTTVTVEGQKTIIGYSLNEGAPAPSYLQIRRNYGNAMKSLGGAVLYDESRYASFKLVKNGKETWAAVEGFNDGSDYTLTIIEVEAMEQEVTANQMLDALNKDGFLALYINFDTGKADIKPESRPVVDEIATLLKDNPDLKLSIEGHTDNVGTAPSNKIAVGKKGQGRGRGRRGRGRRCGPPLGPRLGTGKPHRRQPFRRRPGEEPEGRDRKKIA